jgi:hypothetical protein
VETATGTRNTRSAAITVGYGRNFEAIQRLRTVLEDHQAKPTGKQQRTMTILPDRQSKRQKDKRYEELENRLAMLDAMTQEIKVEMFDLKQ